MIPDPFRRWSALGVVADWLWRVRKREESMLPHSISFSTTEG